jgi:Ca2+-dependent lipid-binding protein
MDADLPHSNTRIEIFVDDMAFPSYVSSTAKSKQHKFDEIGDCFVRELEFSKLTLRIREKGEKQGDGDDKDHTLARLTGSTLDTLKQCLVSYCSGLRVTRVASSVLIPRVRITRQCSG